MLLCVYVFEHDPLNISMEEHIAQDTVSGVFSVLGCYKLTNTIHKIWCAVVTTSASSYSDECTRNFRPSLLVYLLMIYV